MPTLLDSEHFSFLSLLFHFSDPFFSSPSSRLSTVPHFSFFFHSHGSFVILPVCVVRVLSVDSSPLPSFFSAQATFTAFYSFLEPFTPFTPFHGALFFFLVGRLIRRQLLRGGDRYCERNRSRRACESCVSTRLQNASFFSPPPRSTTRGVSTRFALRRLCRESERFLAYAKSIARTDDVA